MYNLLEYSSNYFDTTGSLWFYSKDEAANIVNTVNFKPFMYKTKLVEKLTLKPHQILTMEL